MSGLTAAWWLFIRGNESCTPEMGNVTVSSAPPYPLSPPLIPFLPPVQVLIIRKKMLCVTLFLTSRPGLCCCRFKLCSQCSTCNHTWGSGTLVGSLWCWSPMHQVLLSLSNKMEKQLSSDLMPYMVWSCSPTPDNLPLNLLSLVLFVSEMPFGTPMRLVTS